MTVSSHIVDELLGGPGRIAILRVLSDAEEPLTGRQIAQLSGLSQAGAARALHRLAALGVVSQRVVGRAILHELVRDDPAVQSIVLPVFRAERALLPPARSQELPPAIADGLNPRVLPQVSAIVESCRRHHVRRAALFGSSAQPDAEVTPRDLDVLVTFGDVPAGGYADAYFGLLEELEAIMGMPVDIVVSDAVRNPYLKAELEATQVVLYDAA